MEHLLTQKYQKLNRKIMANFVTHSLYNTTAIILVIYTLTRQIKLIFQYRIKSKSS